MTCTMPWPGVAHRVQPDAELRRSCVRSASTWVRLTGSAIGPGVVGTLWSSVAMVRSGRRTGRPAVAQAVEGLRAGDLVHEVQVDVEQVGLAVGPADDVRVPDLLRQCATHRALLIGLLLASHYLIASQYVIRQYCDMTQRSSVGVLDKAVVVLGLPARRPGLAGRAGRAQRAVARRRRTGWRLRSRCTALSSATTRAGSCSGRRSRELGGSGRRRPARARGRHGARAAVATRRTRARSSTGGAATYGAASPRPSGRADCVTPCRSAPSCR